MPLGRIGRHEVLKIVLIGVRAVLLGGIFSGVACLFERPVGLDGATWSDRRILADGEPPGSIATNQDVERHF
jgi:hypothetical protein